MIKLIGLSIKFLLLYIDSLVDTTTWLLTEQPKIGSLYLMSRVNVLLFFGVVILFKNLGISNDFNNIYFIIVIGLLNKTFNQNNDNVYILCNSFEFRLYNLNLIMFSYFFISFSRIIDMPLL